MNQFNVFIVENDPLFGNILRDRLSLNSEYKISVLTNAKDCLESLYKKPDLVCINYELPDMKGDKLLFKIQSINKHIPVILMSEQEDITLAVNVLKAGAKDYILKNDSTWHLLADSISTIEKNKRIEKEIDEIKKNRPKNVSIEELIKEVKEIDHTIHLKKDTDENLFVIVDYLKSQINERKFIEKELNRTVNLLTILLTNLQAGILVEDENGKILFTNQLFCDMFKIPVNPEVLIGQKYNYSIEQNKNVFKNPNEFMDRVAEILLNKEKVVSDELQLVDGQYLERDFIPIYVHNIYKGHLWNYRNITERRNDENKLHYLINTQEAILNGTNYSIIFTDTNGIIRAYNKGAEKMLGYNAAEIINIETPIIFHDEQDVMLKCTKLSKELSREVKPEEVFIYKPAKGIVETQEWIYKRKNKSCFPVLLTICSIKNSLDEITGFLGIARDISEQKQTEEALKLSEEKYRNILERSTDIIYKTNSRGFFNYVNSVAESITEYLKEDLVDKHFSDLIKEEYKAKAIAFYNAQVFEKKPTTYFEFPIITKKGKEKWIGQSVQYTQINEKEFELTALAIDITERKNYERTMFLQEEKYRNIIANMNLGLIEVDLEETIQYCNQSFCEISGYTNDELIGKNASDILNIRSNKEAIKNREKGISDMYEIHVKNKQGELKWWIISGAPNYNDEGKLTGSIGIHLDVTEHKRLEQELAMAKEKAEESSKAKETFLANMSHEIRTPLNAIIGMIRELSRETLSEKQELYVQNTSVASQHLLSVLNNILDMSKIEAGEFELDSNHFNLRDIINEVSSMMVNKAEQKNLALKTFVSEDIWSVLMGDAVRIRQILLNLVGNAIKFTDKGEIDITCSLIEEFKHTQTIQISIKDTGIGMDAAYLKNIFNKFSQEDKSTSRKYGGTGLGMAITRELIQLMNGEIEVSSKKNKGTCIDIKIPLTVRHDLKLVKEKNTETRNLNGLHVLLVEDNEFNRLVAVGTLNHYNCIVTEAVNGLEAIEKLKEETFDVVLMDLQMPVMDGFEATKIIRDDLKLAIPIIGLTANAFKSEIDYCLKIGMNDWVTKPYEEKTLIDTIIKNSKIDKRRTIMSRKKHGIKKLYNLNKLVKLSRGDKEYMKKVIELFTHQSINSIKEMREAFTNNDLNTIRQIAHKIKPSFDSLEIHSLKAEIKEIEEGIEPENLEGLLKLINHTDSILTQVIKQLQKENY